MRGTTGTGADRIGRSESGSMEKDLIYQVNFVIHAAVPDGEFDIESVVDNIVRTVESDPRCEVLCTGEKGKLRSYWEGREAKLSQGFNRCSGC